MAAKNTDLQLGFNDEDGCKKIPFNYRTTMCKNGDTCRDLPDCPFAHTDKQLTKQVCLYYYTSGKCNRKKCDFLHFTRSREYPAYILIPGGFSDNITGCPYDTKDLPCRLTACRYCCDEPKVIAKRAPTPPKTDEFPALNTLVVSGKSYSDVAKPTVNVEPALEHHVDDDNKTLPFSASNANMARYYALLNGLDEVYRIVEFEGRNGHIGKERYLQILLSNSDVRYAWGL